MCGINRNYGNPYERDSYDDEVVVVKTPLLWS